MLYVLVGWCAVNSGLLLWGFYGLEGVQRWVRELDDFVCMHTVKQENVYRPRHPDNLCQ